MVLEESSFGDDGVGGGPLPSSRSPSSSRLDRGELGSVVEMVVSLLVRAVFELEFGSAGVEGVKLVGDGNDSVGLLWRSSTIDVGVPGIGMVGEGREEEG